MAVTRKYLKRRIPYSYGHPGSFNPAVITNKEAHSDLRKQEQRNWVFRTSCWLSQENKSKISASSACCVGQMYGPDFQSINFLLQKKRKHILVDTIKKFTSVFRVFDAFLAISEDLSSCLTLTRSL